VENVRMGNGKKAGFSERSELPTNRMRNNDEEDPKPTREASSLALLGARVMKRLVFPQITAFRHESLNVGASVESSGFIDVVQNEKIRLSPSRSLSRFEHILVPIDFSEGSLFALPYASILALHFGCLVTLLHVVRLNIVGEDRGIPLTRYTEQLQSAAKQALSKIGPSVSERVRTVVRVGDPVFEIAQEAIVSEIDLIILGKPKGQGLWRCLFPSLEGRIARRVSCSILVAC